MISFLNKSWYCTVVIKTTLLNWKFKLCCKKGKRYSEVAVFSKAIHCTSEVFAGSFSSLS